MSAENQERSRIELRDTMVESVRQLLERNSELSQQILNSIKNGNTEGVPSEVIAALQFTEVLSRTSRTILEDQGSVIFVRKSEEEELPQKREVALPVVNEVDKKEPGIPAAERDGWEEAGARPRTFKELLKIKIDQFLPQDRSLMTEAELVGLLDNYQDVKKAITSLGIPKETREFLRGEAIEISQVCLTRQPDRTKPQVEYDRTRILQSLGGVHASDLDQWAEEIGFNWLKEPIIGAESFIQIRGLSQLRKLVAKREKP